MRVLSFANILQNWGYYVIGLVFLTLAKTKHILQGYKTPKPFSIQNDCDRCIDYDIHIVDEWLSDRASFTGRQGFIENKDVLELGPGSDLGIGVYLLFNGARTYNTIDINNLVKDVPEWFYEAFLDRLQERDVSRDLSES